MKIIYYAHCMDIYHTEQEEEDIKTLEELGLEVCNPSLECFNKLWKEHGMEFANTLVHSCQAFAFRRSKNGKIPSGVITELGIARKMNIPVIELPTIEAEDIMTYPETRAYLEENPSEYYKKRMAERKNDSLPFESKPCLGEQE